MAVINRKALLDIIPWTSEQFIPRIRITKITSSLNRVDHIPLPLITTCYGEVQNDFRKALEEKFSTIKNVAKQLSNYLDISHKACSHQSL